MFSLQHWKQALLGQRWVVRDVEPNKLFLKEWFRSCAVKHRTTHCFVVFVNLDFSPMELTDCETTWRQDTGLPEAGWSCLV